MKNIQSFCPKKALKTEKNREHRILQNFSKKNISSRLFGGFSEKTFFFLKKHFIFVLAVGLRSTPLRLRLRSAPLRPTAKTKIKFFSKKKKFFQNSHQKVVPKFFF
jgi:hypothetical protein